MTMSSGRRMAWSHGGEKEGDIERGECALADDDGVHEFHRYVLGVGRVRFPRPKASRRPPNRKRSAMALESWARRSASREKKSSQIWLRARRRCGTPAATLRWISHGWICQLRHG